MFHKKLTPGEIIVDLELGATSPFQYAREVCLMDKFPPIEVFIFPNLLLNAFMLHRRGWMPYSRICFHLLEFLYS